MPGDSATVGLVSCRGGGGSGVSGDRYWTFDRGATAACTGTENECVHAFVSFTCTCTYLCMHIYMYYLHYIMY